MRQENDPVRCVKYIYLVVGPFHWLLLTAVIICKAKRPECPIGAKDWVF